MDFLLSEEQRQLRALLRDFAQKELAPKAAYYDESMEFPWESFRKVAKLDVLGIKIPEDYGGLGQGMTSAAIVLEELARACANTAITVLLHTGGSSDSITMFGSDEQKRRYLPAMAQGEKLGAFALSEPDAGSDPASMHTTARLEGGEWVLNGAKAWSTNGGEADIYVVFARTGSEGGGRGISSFIVEKGTPGFSFGKREHKMGVRASATTIEYFEDCRLPRESLLGQEGKGLKQAFVALNKERLGNCAICLGICGAALDEAIAYAKERRTFGQKLSEHQGIRWMIADMAVQLRAARTLVYSAALRLDQGLPHIAEVSMAKAFTNEMAVKLTNDALQIFGALGYTTEYPMERHVRDVRAFSLGGGTPQMQRNIIASRLLGD